ncbi:MAG TPA: glutathione-disulfide reductase [Steroidobacteraceae bacterium]|jgi:glutathione reductase (NADPH)|nr:glutathione-disulfide reductase [Steroidobacteraceae bacterium]
MAEKYDLVVIGGGSGGIAAAQRAAEHGAKVALAESGRLGGTCVNVGCVPKKIMWNAAELGSALHDARDYGFELESAGVDWRALKAKRDAYIERLNGIYAANLAKRNIELVRGHASFHDAHTVSAGKRLLRADHIYIATGGRPRLPLIPGAELGITSDGFFELTERPERVAVVGSSYIAIELAGILAGLGSQTALVLRGDTALKSFDAMLGESALAMLRDDGVEVVLNAIPVELRRAGAALELRSLEGRTLGPFDCVLWAIGRGAAVDTLALERAGVGLDVQGFVANDKYQVTNVPGIYAIGDVSGRAQLTPVAIAAGRRLSDRLFGGQAGRHLDYENIPTVIFGRPPLGTVGLSEKAAAERYGADKLTVYRSSFVPLYNALTGAKARSHLKLITAGSEQRIVGLHVAGQGADEMLQGFAVAVRMGATKKDFDDTVAIHPTSAEELVTMR